jgi:thiol:disulfide interchange protein DsbD
LIIAVIGLFIGQPAFSSETKPVDTGRVVAQMVTSHDQIGAGETFHLALITQMDEHWHIYWKNPGDSGEPVDIYWGEAPEFEVGEIIWPLPNTIPTGPIINYGFDGRVIFPMPVKVPETANVGDIISLDSEVTYLVCKDVCIPEDATFSIAVKVGETILDKRWNYNIEEAIADAPPWSEGDVGLSLENNRLRIEIETPVTKIKHAYFFPDTPGLINHSAPQQLSLGDNGLRLEVESGFSLQNGLSGPISGVLRTESAAGEVSGVWLTAKPDSDLVLTGIKTTAASGLSNVTIWTALIGAFIGGLILNLMPCVFPVISMKALSFTKHAHGDHSEIRRQGWLYTFGVLATFMVLTIGLLALKAAGSKVGWGFQLQNPVVIAGLALLFFAIGLNLLGVFDIRLGAQNVGESLTRKPGASGAFFTGVLAVIVATPCTAPFMAGAIGFALVQPAIVTLIVFLALGFGFALPFLALSHWPSLLRRLPKPGPWMETFKQVLAFFMFAAVIWLLWVLSFQTSENGLAKAMFAMLAFGFGVFMIKRSKSTGKLLGGASIILSLALVLSMHVGKLSQATLSKEAWSPEKVAALRAEGKGVFVDFTAAWCVTCKVNEQLVLNGSADLFEKYNTVFLVADWTNKNDIIADELASYGRSGVPLYLIYHPDNNSVKAEVLPQILTKSVLEDALKGELE